MTTRRRLAFLACAANRARVLLLSSGVALFVTQTARAQESVFTLDPAQTRIEFALPAELHTVRGTFKLKTGTIRFNRTTGAASGEIIVDATSGYTGNHGRDAKMHREILESAKFPEIIFTLRNISGTLTPKGPSPIEVVGVLRLHGEDHDVTLATAVERDGGECKASMRFTVPYVMWGLKSPNTFFLRVSKEVQVEIYAAGTLSSPSGQP